MLSDCRGVYVYQLLLLLHPFNSLLLQDSLSRLAAERYTILDDDEARDDWVTVASAGQHANHLHLAPER